MKSEDITAANQRLMAKREALSGGRAEKGSTSPATTPSMPATTMLEGIRALDEAREQSKPQALLCKTCGRSFEPEWNYSRGLWHYPGFDQVSGSCERCNNLKQISENIEGILRQAGVPPKYVGCSFENFQVASGNAKAYILCKEYIGNPSASLFIYGGWGVGKTHLAAAIARELLLMGKKVMFTSVPKALYEIRKAFQDDARETEEAYIERYLSCSFLILDDFGIEKTTEWTRQTLDYIIYERDSNLKPTIITSNLSLDEISQKVDGRIASRLAGMGSIIKVGGTDFRSRKTELKSYKAEPNLHKADLNVHKKEAAN